MVELYAFQFTLYRGLGTNFKLKPSKDRKFLGGVAFVVKL